MTNHHIYIAALAQLRKLWRLLLLVLICRPRLLEPIEKMYGKINLVSNGTTHKTKQSRGLSVTTRSSVDV